MIGSQIILIQLTLGHSDNLFNPFLILSATVATRKTELSGALQAQNKFLIFALLILFFVKQQDVVYALAKKKYFQMSQDVQLHAQEMGTLITP